MVLPSADQNTPTICSNRAVIRDFVPDRNNLVQSTVVCAVASATVEVYWRVDPGSERRYGGPKQASARNRGQLL